MCFFDPKIWILGQKVNFCMVIAIFVNRAYHKYTRGYNFPFGPPPKKFLFPSDGSIFRAHPCFWPFRAIPTSEVKVPLILDRFQRNLVKPSGPLKKWPRMTMDPVQAGITQERPFLRSAEKCFFLPKMGFNPKITQNFLRDWNLFGKRQLFSLNNFFQSLPEHG